jgi:hypothetical protein
MRPLKVYEVKCTGITVGYLTIDETSEWGQLALREIDKKGGLLWLEPVDNSCLLKYINNKYKENEDGLEKV